MTGPKPKEPESESRDARARSTFLRADKWNLLRRNRGEQDYFTESIVCLSRDYGIVTQR